MRRMIRELLRRGRKEKGPGGIVDGHLAPCPRSPNCVSTQAEDPAKRMDRITVQGSRDEVLARVRTILESWPRTRIVLQEGPYLHAECTTAGLGFVDDLEFLVDEEASRLDFRAASRIGYSDLGMNRRRMQTLANKLAAMDD